jgi:hypothetical protein
MGLFDSILGAASEKGDTSGQANPLIGIVGGLLAQSGRAAGFGQQIRTEWSGERIPIVGWHG